MDMDGADAHAAASGDSRAFERLYVRHQSRIQTLARRLIGAERAEEATHEVFVRVWERLGQFRGDALFATWLHRVAVNALLRQAEVARRIQARSVVLADEDHATTAVDHALAIDVTAALAELAAGIRAVVVLHDMEGYSHEEIAIVIGISVSASKMRLHRGRLALREHLLR